jgi:hypothetical protein
VAHEVGAEVEYNILSRSLFFLQNADIASMWPEQSDVPQIRLLMPNPSKR